MLSSKDIIEKILSQRPDLTESELRKIIRDKMKHSEPLLTEEGAIYMVASELGIDLSNGRVAGTGMKVKDLIIGANDVTITGVVIAVSQVQSFKRKDGVEGKVARLVVSDETGHVNVVLWNEKAGIVGSGKISPNNLVRVSHGYVRAGLNGSPELNVGRRGTVRVISSAPSSSIINPSIHIKKIRDLREGDTFVCFRGIVKGLSRVSNFIRANNRPGQVMRVRLADETGRIITVFWDEKVDYVKNCRRGDVLEITGGSIRRGLGNSLEVHVGRLGRVEVLKGPRTIDGPSIDFRKIGDLRIGMSDVDVLGRVVEVGRIREFERPSRGVGRVGSIYLMDETGSVRLILWNDKADLLNEVSPGDVVMVEGGYTKEGLGKIIELNLGSMGTMKVNPEIKGAETLPSLSSNTVPISELKAGMRNITVEGRVLEAPNVKEVTTRSGEDIRLASLRISDGTGEIEISLWRELAERAEELSRDANIRIKSAYVKVGFYGNLELSSGADTEIEFLGLTEMGRKMALPLGGLSKKRVNELRPGDKAEVDGRIVEVNPNSKVYPSCPNCLRRVRIEGDKWLCEKCGEILKPAPRLILEALVQDETGVVKSVFRGAVAEKLLDMSSEDAWKFSLREESEIAPVEKAKSRVIGAYVRMVGRAVRSWREGDLRFYVEELSLR